MSLAHLNVRSLNIADKLNEIAAIADSYNFEILAFTITWLNLNISNDSLLLSGYHPPLRRDRSQMCGGGVAMYVAEHLSSTRRLDLESDTLNYYGSKLLSAKLKCYVESLTGRQTNLPKKKMNASIVYRIVLISYSQNNFRLLSYWVTSMRITTLSTQRVQIQTSVIGFFNFIECNNLSQLV